LFLQPRSRTETGCGTLCLNCIELHCIDEHQNIKISSSSSEGRKRRRVRSDSDVGGDYQYDDESSQSTQASESEEGPVVTTTEDILSKKFHNCGILEKISQMGGLTLEVYKALGLEHMIVIVNSDKSSLRRAKELGALQRQGQCVFSNYPT